PVERVSFVIWSITGLLAGLAAILIGPTRPLGLSVALGPFLMLRALASAMLGGLSGFFAVFAAGLTIGVLENLVVWNYPVGGALDIVLLAAITISFLLKKGLGTAARGAEESSWALAASIKPLHRTIASAARTRAAQYVGIAVLVAIAAFIPTFASVSEQFFLGGVALFGIFGLSLVVLTGFAGQVSLGQFAFVAIGAAFGGRFLQLGFSHLAA
ncbi:MAG TPA: hypothetical protein PLV68_04120, partial [Ilumatobacteraceae bacterium]|nr:hypothetical protein [Ilumatobacteraceae bacterium]